MTIHDASVGTLVVGLYSRY